MSPEVISLMEGNSQTIDLIAVISDGRILTLIFQDEYSSTC